MSPDPIMLFSTFIGFPLYRMSPDPATEASRLSLTYNLTFPEPATDTSAVFAIKS